MTAACATRKTSGDSVWVGGWAQEGAGGLPGPAVGDSLQCFSLEFSVPQVPLLIFKGKYIPKKFPKLHV